MNWNSPEDTFTASIYALRASEQGRVLTQGCTDCWLSHDPAVEGGEEGDAGVDGSEALALVLHPLALCADISRLDQPSVLLYSVEEGLDNLSLTLQHLVASARLDAGRRRCPQLNGCTQRYLLAVVVYCERRLCG